MKQVLLLMVFWLISHVASAQWTDGQAAFRVIGQPDFTSNTQNGGGIGGKTLFNPNGIAIDALNGKIYVSDEGNNRVLRYNYPVTSNQPTAELVFGQPDFISSTSGSTSNSFDRPRGIAVDLSGRLWVADQDNNRVVWFDDAHLISTNKPIADGVLGQPDFVTISSGLNAQKMNAPSCVEIDDNSNTLWVGDNYNNRVLRFDNASSLSSNAAANGVLGQTDFTSNSEATSQSKFIAIWDLAVDANGNLYLCNNERILRFDNAASKSNGAAADGVLGEANFTSIATGTSATEMNKPRAVATDFGGRLYVLDVNNNRILIFNNAAFKANGGSADNVLGQDNFISGFQGTSDSDINPSDFLSAIAVDETTSTLWLSDGDNHRVLGFDANTPLPVELTSFQGNFIEGLGNRLAWTTASEENNKGFEVEYSTNGEYFQYLGFVSGHGTTLENQAYSFVHQNPTSTLTYYRLKQIDFDLSYEYSNIIIVENDRLSPAVKIYPNPAIRELFIENVTGSAVIYNLFGQKVRQVQLKDHLTIINLIDLEEGQYVLEILSDQGQRIVKRFVK